MAHDRRDFLDALLLQFTHVKTAEDVDKELTALRRRLITFFRFQRAADPEDLAQETLLRAFRRLAEGWEPAPKTSAVEFLFEIARNVPFEQRRVQRSRMVEPLAEDTRVDMDADPQQIRAILLNELLASLDKNDAFVLTCRWTN